jgi:SNF2 family DNA or RNA helicase
MGREDRPCLSKVKWAYIVVDEGHRLKNVGCKLATELKLFKADNRLLITGNLISARRCNVLVDMWTSGVHKNWYMVVWRKHFTIRG